MDFPVIPGIDTEKAINNFDNDCAFFLELLEIFFDQLIKTNKDIESELADHSPKEAILKLHTLAGNAGSVGADSFMLKARQLEQALASNLEVNEIDVFKEAFFEELALLIQSIRPFVDSAI